MMEVQSSRGRGVRIHGAGERTQSKNKKWVAGQDNVSAGHSSDNERRERSGPVKRHLGRGRANVRHHPSRSLGAPDTHPLEDGTSGTEDDHSMEGDVEPEEGDNVDEEAPDSETPQERERFWQELVKAREVERKKAIGEGKMDDPTVPRRLDDAITMVGTCTDMCPRFERYRRERENNLDKWEVIPGTKRVDHKRAVKIYERAAGDKTLPSDLRPPPVLKKTLDYLFHDLLRREGFTQTYDFIRDRSRAVRSDFTMQHEQGPLAIECHDRSARFHILALHLERENPRFSVALEEQQLMNTLQSLKEFYEDQRGKYEAPTELEMRVYHRLIHIRDQRERREDVPEWITSHPVFLFTTQFRLHVQAKSAPITKTSRLIVDAEGMDIFSKLAAVLRQQGNTVMIYLVACILERLFGKDTIDDIEAIRGDLTIQEIIDGISRSFASSAPESEVNQPVPTLVQSDATNAVPYSAPFAAIKTTLGVVSGSAQPVRSAFGNLTSKPNPFDSKSAFGTTSAFGTLPSVRSAGNTTSAFSAFANNNTPLTVQLTSDALGTTSGSSGLFLTQPAATAFAQTTPKATVRGPNGNTFGTATFPATGLNPSAPSFALPKASSIFSTPATFAQPSPPTRTEPAEVGINGQSQTVSITPATTPAQASIFLSPPPVPTPPVVTSPSKLTTQPRRSPDTIQITAPKIPPSPARIIERQQTLWDIPSSASPQPQTPPPNATTSTSSTIVETPSPSNVRPAISPLVPPALEKAPPLSLPPTPTARWFDPGSGKSSATLDLAKKKSLLAFPSLLIPSSGSAELLSPLQMNPPRIPKVAEPSGSPSPQPRDLPTVPVVEYPVQEEPTEMPFPLTSSKSKGKAKAIDLNNRSDELAEVLSRWQRLQCRVLARFYFKKWMNRTIDRGQWREACERSDAYKAKIEKQREQMPPSFSTPAIQILRKEEPKRRRLSEGDAIRSRRIRRRAAPIYYVQPLSDEQLARRLKENHEEQKQRWARGTFLRTVRAHLKKVKTENQSLAEWRLWLSVNPSVDPTAIWLEKKFEVPESGEWESEAVFSIPATTTKPSSRGSPGLIIFERTPLDDAKDDIERKFRVLEDCARLRDMVASFPLPQHRRFTPTVIVVHWVQKADAKKVDDFTDMAKQRLEEGTFAGVHVLAASEISGGLDAKFSEFMTTVTLDLEDCLVSSMSWKALVRQFITPYKTMASDWFDSCWTVGSVDWARFGYVFEAIRGLQPDVARLLLDLLGSDENVDVEYVPNPESHALLGQGHIMGPFLDALVELPFLAVEQALAIDSSSPFTVDKTKLQKVLGDMESAIQSHNDLLREQWVTALAERSSAKRPAEDDESVLESLPSSHSQKRLRSDSGSSVDDGTVPLTNGVSASPSPSIISMSTEVDRAYVSVAMLRSLTRDVLKTYGRTHE